MGANGHIQKGPAVRGNHAEDVSGDGTPGLAGWMGRLSWVYCCICSVQKGTEGCCDYADEAILWHKAPIL
jgi:hypothetical protein